MKPHSQNHIKSFNPLKKIKKWIRSANRYRKNFRILVKQKGSFGKAYQYLRRHTQKHGFQASQLLLSHLHTPVNLNPYFNSNISIIIPHYHHIHIDNFIENLDNILNQDYDLSKLEVIIIHYTDIITIQHYLKNKNVKYQLIHHEIDSTNRLMAWKKGFEVATNDLIWLPQSNLNYHTDFLKQLAPIFKDSAVNIALGAMQLMDKNSHNIETEQVDILPAAQWFNTNLGTSNMMVNIGASLFRRQILADEIWEKKFEFQICSDWFLYLKLAGAGKIAYVPKAILFFRQPENGYFEQLNDYTECFKMSHEIYQQWKISPNTQKQFIEYLKSKYQYFQMDKKYGLFETQFHQELNQQTIKQNLHIQIYFLGFHVGGGELFPIVLANQLKELGYMVSMVAMDLDNINQDMLNKLSKGIAIYPISDLFQQPDFLKQTGVDIVHTHIITTDCALSEYLKLNNMSIPYIVTMHGSHQKQFLHHYQENIVNQINQYVTKWVYIADKNLDFFDGHALPKHKLVKLPNAMPVDTRVASTNRLVLNIDENAIVFAFAARGIIEKGWLPLTQAFIHLKKQFPSLNIHLLMMGEGKAKEQAQKIAQNYPFIHFLGYETAVNGVFRYSDCVILPSRFEGESYPLCLIQAMQEHLPCIATDIGEIRSMITHHHDNTAGILINNEADDEQFIHLLADAIIQMCDDDVRMRYQKVAQEIAKRYDMSVLAERYIDLYREAIQNKD